MVQQFYAVNRITVRAANCPKPILTFQEACFPGEFAFVVSTDTEGCNSWAVDSGQQNFTKSNKLSGIV